MSSQDAVRYSVADGVATLTMDQPHKRNALTPALLGGLADGLGDALADEAVRVIVLTNTGPVFCAGADLSGGRPASGTSPGAGRADGATARGAAAGGGQAGGTPVGGGPGGGSAGGESSGGDGVGGRAPRLGLAEILAAIQDSPKPVVGRIAGHCLGGGIGLAAACDLSVAGDNVRFGFTEVRIGVVPAIISVVCLPKLRRGDALELFLSGERISAARAAEIGLITRAVPAAELASETDAVVANLLAGGPAALAAAKALVYAVPGMKRQAAFDRTTELSRSLFASAEAAEGMAAFREKRPPTWARVHET
jgi:methylglutaconyl-CoA hydratase